MNNNFLFNNKCVITKILMLLPYIGIAQTTLIPADVYRWDKVSVNDNIHSQQRVFLEGSTPAFRHLKVHATTVPAGQAPHPGHSHSDEELVIVKEGQLTVTIAGKTDTLETGSIALILPNDFHSFENRGNRPVSYYVMRYKATAPDPKRAANTGQSFVRHWKDMEYKPHDKGGRRNVFDQKTTEAQRFEMHITTLNEGLMSHPPHTHVAAEILLLIEGEAEESIDGKWMPAGVGDIIFLQSQVKCH